MQHKIRALCVSYEPWQDRDHGLCQIAPGAVDLSAQATSGIEIADEQGHLLGVIGDGSARVEELKPGDYGLRGWPRGVMLELTNLDTSNEADRRAIHLIETGAPGFRVDFDEDAAKYERTSNGIRYTALRIEKITLDAEHPDNGTGRILFLTGVDARSRGPALSRT